MDRTRRSALYALVVLLLLGMVQPAEAETARAARTRRESLNRKRASVAARLNTLKATDTELERAVRALDAQVLAQVARADAARQAVQAANAAVVDAEARLRATERELASRRQAVINRAVISYVNPYGGLLGEVVNAKDLAEATRKQELLEYVTGGDRVLVERLRATQEDLTALHGVLARAREGARTRRAQVVTRLTDLRSSRAQQARVRAALDSRIREFIAEADALAAQESALVAYIRQREAQDQASATVGVSRAGLVWPLRGRITSGFGMRWGRLHAGIDIGAGRGAPIRAARDGTVIGSGWQGGYGNVVIISHGGITTLYAHQSRRAAADGQRVSQGQVIGYVGSTGHSTGPHLHFEVRVGGSPVNPLRYLP